uniref:Odorant receptor n=1 Tax=Bracon brevicornis TaxID=1563983 RepID=A0A6V7KB76_9HYME
MMVDRAKFCDILAKSTYVMSMIPLFAYILNMIMLNKQDEAYDGSSNSSADKSTFMYLLPDGCAYERFVDNLALNYIINFNQVIQMTILIGTTIICDSYYVTITLHLCEQCEILKMAFEKLGIMGGYEENRFYFRCLVVRHQHLMMIAETLEHVYNEIILLQMLGMLLVFNISGINYRLIVK